MEQNEIKYIDDELTKRSMGQILPETAVESYY